MKLAVIISSVALTSVASADLVLFGTTDQTGTGFGTVNTILSLQRPDSGSGIESGATFRNPDGGGTNGSSGDATSQGEVRTIELLMGLGIDTASELAIVYNLNETGEDPRNILQDLSLTIYSPDGASVFTATYTGPDLDLDVVNQGTGGDGYVFVLDAAQAAQAQVFFQPQNYVGMAATIDDADNGPDNFYPLEIPEPGTALLLAIGVLAATRRQRTA